MKGRKPEGTNLRVLKGKRKTHRAKPRPAGAWRSPRWLGKYGREFHRNNFQLARDVGTLTELDRDSWFVLAHTYHVIRQCLEELKTSGLTIKDSRDAIKKHPSTAILNQLMTHYRQMCDNFGLTPQSRERLGLKKPGPKSKMEEFIT